MSLIVRCTLIAAAGLRAVSVTQSAYASCAQALPIPFETTTIDDARPTIRWQPVAGATRYRVQLDSRVPEGRRILAFDTYVSVPEFVAPQPLTDFRARVTVLVTAECNGDAGVPSNPLRFEIDTSTRCSLRPGSVKRKGDEIVWDPVDDSVSYRVSVYDKSSNLLSRQELRRERVVIASFKNATVFSVRPKCQVGWGEAVYISLAH